MGVCLCKDKIEDGQHTLSSSDSVDNEIRRQCAVQRTVDNCRMIVLSETVDRLVRETLEVIGSMVDKYVNKISSNCYFYLFIFILFFSIFSEHEQFTSMIMLHDITDKPNGWLQLVKSLVRVVPVEHPMGPSVIMLLLDDSPLPTKDSVLEVADMITHSLRRTPRRERNLCIILGCLAEKLAGISVAVLSETTLGYLLGNLVS